MAGSASSDLRGRPLQRGEAGGGGQLGSGLRTGRRLAPDRDGVAIFRPESMRKPPSVSFQLRFSPVRVATFFLPLVTLLISPTRFFRLVVNELFGFFSPLAE